MANSLKKRFGPMLCSVRSLELTDMVSNQQVSYLVLDASSKLTLAEVSSINEIQISVRLHLTELCMRLKWVDRV